MRNLMLFSVFVIVLGFTGSAQKVKNTKTGEIKDLKEFPIKYCSVELTFNTYGYLVGL
jgi:hypothetical protein